MQLGVYSVEERGEADLAMNFFMALAIKKPMAKNNAKKKATVAMLRTSPGDELGMANAMTIVTNQKGIDINKKSWAFMFLHYSLFDTKILLLRLLSSMPVFYKKPLCLRG